MGVIHASDMHVHELAGVRFTGLLAPSQGSSELMAWRTEVPPGTPATPHQVTREELVVILSGTARVQLAGTTTEAAAGDTVLVPPDTDVVIENAGDETLRMLACMPAAGRARLGGETRQLPWMV